MSDLIERVEAACRFPTNTCPASRHAVQIGEALMRGEPYPMLTEESAHCGESILSTVASLWEARTQIERLTAALRAQPGPVSMDDMEWAGKVHLAEAIRERDEHARWRADLADKLHDRETTISAAWEALRSAGVHSEATIDDGIRLLRRQLAEAEMDAERYRWLRGEHKRVDPICAVIWKRNGDRNGSEWVNTANIDAEIDAAMGASNE